MWFKTSIASNRIVKIFENLLSIRFGFVYLDLTLKFKVQEIVAALGSVYDGDVYLLTLTGEIIDGTPIEGTDCIVIIAKGSK